MNIRACIWILLFFMVLTEANGQTHTSLSDTLTFKGQLISWTNINPSGDFPFWIGGRYLPQINFEKHLPKSRLFDLEASVNMFGNLGFRSNDAVSQGDLRPYRMWARFSAPQWELRLGLQKINFGSASILRPLMWFDQIDPRDPIQFTDGVWGLLGRYYFLNNANIWVWGLYGNENPRGWELAPTAGGRPEFGGRMQLPIPSGEVGFSTHHRTADTRNLNGFIPALADVPETRFGLDVRLDLAIGCWAEASWTSSHEDLEAYTNQELINVGMDYTFGIGNGLYLAFEQLLVSNGKEPFDFSNSNTLSLLSASYPIGFFDQLGLIIYFDWTNQQAYNFLSWMIQFDQTTLYLMGYWNPENTPVSNQNNSTQNLYTGAGVQALLLFNH